MIILTITPMNKDETKDASSYNMWVTNLQFIVGR